MAKRLAEMPVDAQIDDGLGRQFANKIMVKCP